MKKMVATFDETIYFASGHKEGSKMLFIITGL